MKVVGIGASAGGLEAIRAFVQSCTDHRDHAFLVVQHLSPDFKSMMDSLLQRHTALKVQVAHDGIAVKPGTIYLNTPHADMTYESGALRLVPWDDRTIHRRPIDALFESLAEELGPAATAIVLSGSGSDGAKGAAHIARVGGRVFAQDPETAAFDIMPQAAISTGAVEAVGAPEALPEKLLVDHRPDAVVSDDGEGRAQLQRVVPLVREAHGLSLGDYKTTTMLRRLRRRAEFAGAPTLRDYVDRLTSDPEELRRFYEDLLIGATRFFRDPTAWPAVAKLVRQRLETSTELRVWVAGCATGEEAYSLGMLLTELTGNSDRVKIFATDVDSRSIAIASQGVYSAEAVQDIPEGQLHRFFVAYGSSWRVRPALRRMVVFANHNLLQDPPFSAMDLVSCRNLLIYLNADGQQRALSHLLFATRVGGMLWLGPSESLGDMDEGVSVLDTRWNLFRKDERQRHRLRSPIHLTPRPIAVGPSTSERMSRELVRAYDRLLETYAPPGFLVGNNRELIHVFGKAAELLQRPTGRLSHDIIDLVTPELRSPLGAAIYRCQRDLQPVAFPVALPSGSLRIQVRPLGDLATGSMVFVAVGDSLQITGGDAETMDTSEEVAKRTAALEQELAWTRESLQVTLERAESTNEELQSANEELQSTNEELQSVNEELHSVNAEYQASNAELVTLSEDMLHLLQSTRIGVVFLDDDLQIRRFTKEATRFFNLRAGDEGRPFAHLATTDAHRTALEKARLCRDQGTDQDCSLEMNDTEVVLQARPFVDPNQRQRGVVLSVVDVSRVRAAESKVLLQAAMLDMLSVGLSVLRPEPLAPGVAGPPVFRLIYANAAAGRILRTDLSALVDAPLAEAIPAFVEANYPELYAQVLAKQEHATEILPLRRADGELTQLRHTAGPGPENTVIVIFEDVSQEVRDQEETAAARRNRVVGELAAGIAHDLNNLLTVMLLGISDIQDLGSPPVNAHAGRVRDAGNRAADLVARLLTYSRRRMVSPQQVRLSALVADAEPMLARILAPTVTLETELATDEDDEVEVDISAMEQVLVNLAANSVAAIAQTGTVKISVSVDHSARPAWVVLRFTDDGPGMSPDVLARCQEPYFTTRTGGVGTGLGLATVAGAIDQANGQLTIQSRQGEGVHVTIRLPRTRRPVSPPVLRIASGPARSETVLVVDDERRLVHLVSHRLRRAGFTVWEATSAAEALDAIAEHGAPDLLLTDVLMPEMDGPALAAAVHADHPGVAVLYMSGYSSHESVRRIMTDPTLPLIDKPFLVEDLIAAVDKVLSAAPEDR